LFSTGFQVSLLPRNCYGPAMSMHRSIAIANRVMFLCAVIIAPLLLGCSTTRKVDWNRRVGSYTYDQAVAELGPPDKQATLSNAITVAEWVTQRSKGSSVSFGTGYSGSGVGAGVGQTVDSGSSDHWLRLVFDREGTLSSWSKN
jgi:hypothetical protein